eukprot:SAG22_NODE_14_length_33165_cov_13.196698_42_plen_156_part_00
MSTLTLISSSHLTVSCRICRCAACRLSSIATRVCSSVLSRCLLSSSIRRSSSSIMSNSARFLASCSETWKRSSSWSCRSSSVATRVASQLASAWQTDRKERHGLGQTQWKHRRKTVPYNSPQAPTRPASSATRRFMSRTLTTDRQTDRKEWHRLR